MRFVSPATSLLGQARRLAHPGPDNGRLDLQASCFDSGAARVAFAHRGGAALFRRTRPGPSELQARLTEREPC